MMYFREAGTNQLKRKQMKKLIPIFSIAVTALVMVACNSNPKIAGQSTTPAAVVQPPTVLQDTSGLAEYQAWKVMNEMKDSKDYGQPEQAVAATAPVRKAPRISSPSRAVNPRTETPPPQAPAPVPAATPQAPVSTAPDAGAGSTASTGAGTDASTAGTGETAKVEQKKGMSNKTKGAVIGGVVGAGAGAVINKKNPVVGAVVGAVLGAGGGYVIGSKMDKKTGQIN
jgi:hypothetical protein